MLCLELFKCTWAWGEKGELRLESSGFTLDTCVLSSVLNGISDFAVVVDPLGNIEARNAPALVCLQSGFDTNKKASIYGVFEDSDEMYSITC